MLPVELLALAARGAYNMHGSLLPKYRGRVPVNWAVLHGETETGATLHEMAAKPDAGAIVAQRRCRSCPTTPPRSLRQGHRRRRADALARAAGAARRQGAAPAAGSVAGSYFGGRKPEDGRIDWSQPAQQVYNLVRAVAPPYPGAFTDVGGERFIVARARLAPRPARFALGFARRACT